MNAVDALFDLGRRLSELRAERGMTQDQLSELLEIDPTHLRRIEGGRVDVGVEMLTRFANAFGCMDLRELFEAPKSRAVTKGRPKGRKPAT